MKKSYHIVIAAAALASCGGEQSAAPRLSAPNAPSIAVAPAAQSPNDSDQTFVEKFGALSVTNGKITDSQGRNIALSGMSHFWSNTYFGQEAIYNADIVNYIADEWNASLFRAAMGVDERGGFLEDKANETRARTVIDAAIAKGAYVIIDWHSHHAEKYPDAAVEFFTRMAKEYGETDNVIYEIYNEPLNTVTWDQDVKPYSEKVIAAIRAVDPDNLIIVGSPTWSQDVDIAAKNPIIGYDNIAYTMHFYSGSHGAGLRTKTETAIKAGAAVFVTEWGTINANGDGDVATQSVKKWVEFMDKHCLSNANWSISNKAEGASIFKPGTSQTGGWSDDDLTASGKVVKEIVQNGTRICE